MMDYVIYNNVIIGHIRYYNGKWSYCFYWEFKKWTGRFKTKEECLHEMKCICKSIYARLDKVFEDTNETKSRKKAR